MWPCGKAAESRIHMGECNIYIQGGTGYVRGEDLRKIDECGMEKIGTQDSSEKTIAILGDRWWPQTAKQQGDKVSKKFLCNIWKKRNKRPNVGGVSY